MLHLLPSGLFNKISDRQLFLQKIFLFVFLGHVIFFVFLFLFSMSKKEDKFTILMHQAGATYVLMPLQKKVDQKNNATVISKSAGLKKSQVLNYEDYLQKKGSQVSKKKTQNTKESLSLKKNKNQKTSAKISSKKKSSTVIASSEKHSKNNKKSQGKKDKIKLLADSQTVKNNDKKSLKDTVQELSKIEEVKKDISLDKEKILEQNLEQNNDVKKEEETNDTSLEEVIFVGYEQFDECVISSKIQHAVVQSWTPPVGLEQGTSCEMKIVVSDKGLAESVEIVRTSGILLYDTSARTALSEIEFPKEVYGKTIKIVLGN